MRRGAEDWTATSLPVPFPSRHYAAAVAANLPCCSRSRWKRPGGGKSRKSLPRGFLASLAALLVSCQKVRPKLASVPSDRGRTRRNAWSQPVFRLSHLSLFRFLLGTVDGWLPGSAKRESRTPAEACDSVWGEDPPTLLRRGRSRAQRCERVEPVAAADAQFLPFEAYSQLRPLLVTYVVEAPLSRRTRRDDGGEKSEQLAPLR